MGLRTHKQLSNILIIFSFGRSYDPFGLATENPNTHLVGECFEVQSDLMGASEVLGSRSHLLPMSDSTRST